MRRLQQVHNQAVTMQDQCRGRQDALAELADMEGQLVQTQVPSFFACLSLWTRSVLSAPAHAWQVYTHLMASELSSLHSC